MVEPGPDGEEKGGTTPEVVREGATDLPVGTTELLEDVPTEPRPDEETGKEVGTESVFVFDGVAELPDGAAYAFDDVPAELEPVEETGNEVGTESVLVFEEINEIPPEPDGKLYPLDEVPLEVETVSVAVEMGVPGRDAVPNTLETGASELRLLIVLTSVPGRLKVGRSLE